jgi:chaperone required for assembly of F1-ATPase
MAEWAPRVFWKEAAVVERAGGFSVTLDGRPVRTPAKRPLDLPTRAMAEAVAGEWAAQEETVNPLTMPVTRAANAALDKVAPQQEEVAAMIAAYGETDLLCYRAERPEELAERQRLGWDPLLDWAAEAHGARLEPVAGVMPRAQAPQALDRLSQAVARRGAFELVGLSDLVSLSGSLVLGLAVDEGYLDPEDGWELSRIDERFQEEQWGRDEEAAEEAEVKRQAFLQARRFLLLAR